jgi:hypothetical protein
MSITEGILWEKLVGLKKGKGENMGVCEEVQSV